MALSPPQDHWLPGFNFNLEEWEAEGAALRDSGGLPLARPGPRRVRGRGRRETRRSVHDPQLDTGSGAPPGRPSLLRNSPVQPNMPWNSKQSLAKPSSTA